MSAYKVVVLYKYIHCATNLYTVLEWVNFFLQLREINQGEIVRNKIETFYSSDQKNQTFILERSDKYTIEE